MSPNAIVNVHLSARADAVPEAHFFDWVEYSSGFINFDGSGPTAAALHLPVNVPAAVAYLDGLIRAACSLRNEYVEWAKSHDVALAA